MGKIGFLGLGKLGLPCAAAISVKTGSTVLGFDLNPQVKTFVDECKVPYLELECDTYLRNASIEIKDSIEEVVAESEILFIAVQTPHEPEFEGVTPVTERLSDFDYSHLISAVTSVGQALENLPKKNLTIVIISTVLPGTMRKHILPTIEKYKDRVSFCYNPFFIAMGQTIQDFLNPEFVLIGVDDLQAGHQLSEFYKEIHSKDSRIMGIESAELTKVAYNTFIGFKIVFANTLREIVQVRGGNVDEITSALASATDRLMSAKYLSAGMGDGGGCHPRDQIAMSWLAKDADLSTDIFGFLAKSRDLQSFRQAQEIKNLSESFRLPVYILGAAYKANINLTVGSPSLLLVNQLETLGVEFQLYDPHVFPDKIEDFKKGLYFIATNHDIFKSYSFPVGSIILDPWGDVVSSSRDYEVIRPGRI
jgi:UDPglucose 6-dehydrogenase